MLKKNFLIASFLLLSNPYSDAHDISSHGDDSTPSPQRSQIVLSPSSRQFNWNDQPTEEPAASFPSYSSFMNDDDVQSRFQEAAQRNPQNKKTCHISD